MFNFFSWRMQMSRFCRKSDFFCALHNRVTLTFSTRGVTDPSLANSTTRHLTPETFESVMSLRSRILKLKVKLHQSFSFLPLPFYIAVAVFRRIYRVYKLNQGSIHHVQGALSLILSYKCTFLFIIPVLNVSLKYIANKLW